jgi:hypothetical protein
MGLLTQERGPPDWHPASQELKDACRRAAQICHDHNLDISTLALLVALANESIPCTVLGMARVEEVKVVQTVTNRFRNIPSSEKEQPTLSPDAILMQVLDDKESKVLSILRDANTGPFASVWNTGLYRWDGMEAARQFWKQLDEKSHIVDWHPK